MIFTCGEGRYEVRLEIIEHDEGLTAVLTGGEKSHVGAVALAMPADGRDRETAVSETAGRSLETSSPRCQIDTRAVPGHKDDLVAGPLAEALCEAVGAPVAVSAGLHIENATKEEITRLVDHCHEVTEQAAAWYRKGRTLKLPVVALL